MIITIDGPSGTGKSTVAKKVAETLNFFYCDTGAIYRTLTYGILKGKINLKDDQQLLLYLEKFRFEVRKGRYFLDDVDVTEIIRSQEVTGFVSEVSSLKVVRQALLGLQRDIAKVGNVVFEGRDMGTVVFPEADVKIFLTADPEVRAKRRFNELKEKNELSLSQVFLDLERRDTFDSKREIAPLKQAEDAHLIDTTQLNVDEVVSAIVKIVNV